MKIKILLTFILTLAVVVSCKKLDANYEKFIENGPIVYPGKVDSIFSYSGDNRIKLTWKVPFDGNIKSYKVFWNFGSDSLIIKGANPTGPDSVRSIIENLQEGTYSFSVYTYDQFGRRSVPTRKVARSYGSIFTSTIYNRQIRTSVKDAKTSTVTVTWVNLDLNCVGTEWLYTKQDGTSGAYFSPFGSTTTITNCNVTKPITYRSIYVPEPTAIDRYYSVYSTL